VRFIAENNNLDTANGFDIMSIFRDVINEWYVADTSRKIKTVFKSRIANIARELRAGGTSRFRGRNPRHCGRGNMADCTEDMGNCAPHTQAAERPEPSCRTSLLRRLRF